MIGMQLGWRSGASVVVSERPQQTSASDHWYDFCVEFDSVFSMTGFKRMMSVWRGLDSLKIIRG